MAPALTHTAEPLTLAEATRHSSSPLSSKFKCLRFTSPIFDSDKCTIGSAPPDFGGADSLSPNSGFGCTMEESPPIPSSDSGISEHEVPEFTPATQPESSMGSHINYADTALLCNPKAAAELPGNLFDQSQPQEEFIRTMGYNEIFETLTKLASNPELLEATEREFLPSGLIHQVESPEERIAVSVSRLLSKQKKLERKQLFLIRRLRRLSSRGLGATVSSQLNYLVSEGKKHVKDSKQNEEGESALQVESMKDLPTSALVSLVKKLENLNPNNHVLPDELRKEACVVVGKMKAAARHHRSHDSDATESSSEESGDEPEESHTGTAFKPIKDRALYKYYQKRSYICSRAAWVKIRLANIEEEIAKHEKEYKKIRENKGQVIFCDTYGRTKDIRTPCELETKTSHTCITSPRSKLNGFHQQDLHEDESCSRTFTAYRPKKRTYVRTNKFRRNKNMESQCDCVSPFTCVSCSGESTQICDNSDVHTKQYVGDRIASVDMSFHPVLSKKTDMLQSEVYTSCFISSPPFASSSLTLSHQVSKEEQHNDSDYEPSKKRKKDHKDIRKKKKDKETRDKYVNSKNIDNTTGEDVRWGRNSPMFDCDRTRERILTRSESAAEREKEKERAKKLTAPSSNSSNNKHKNTTNSYDINNIVIPPNMASGSKVESLPYKEILTPKWRLCDLPPLDFFQENYIHEEDLSDETFKIRHSICEEKEKKINRGSKIKTQQRYHRSRSTRDSSGTNTPDHPLSPRTLDSVMETPIGSPFIEPSEDSNHSSKSSSSIITNPTILSLSLSEVQSPVPDSSPQVNGDEQNRTEGPASKNRRIISTNQDKFFRPITPITMPQDIEKKCLSPFPCRSFPLNESDTDNLHHIISEKINLNAIHGSLLSNSFNVSDQIQRFKLKSSNGKPNICDEISNEPIKSGSDTPRSELTDSAPEEELGEWDDSTPNWTISAMKDGVGCCLLQVERN